MRRVTPTQRESRLVSQHQDRDIRQVGKPRGFRPQQHSTFLLIHPHTTHFTTLLYYYTTLPNTS